MTPMLSIPLCVCKATHLRSLPLPASGYAHTASAFMNLSGCLRTIDLSTSKISLWQAGMKLFGVPTQMRDDYSPALEGAW